MKFFVRAKITDSPTMPTRTAYAEKEFEFPDGSNAFGRAYDARQYFKTTYKTDKVEFVKVVQTEK